MSSLTYHKRFGKDVNSKWKTCRSDEGKVNDCSRRSFSRRLCFRIHPFPRHLHHCLRQMQIRCPAFPEPPAGHCDSTKRLINLLFSSYKRLLPPVFIRRQRAFAEVVPDCTHTNRVYSFTAISDISRSSAAACVFSTRIRLSHASAFPNRFIPPCQTR